MEAVLLHREVEMLNVYPFLYRVGMTPWDDQQERGPIPGIVASRPPGRALDAGCGTGALAVELARAGWDVTGVDGVPRALRRAEARAAAAGVQEHRCRFVHGDVSDLDAVLPDAQLDLVTDLGCLHGLTRRQQESFARWVNAHTGEGADLVVLAVEPRRGVGPHGLDERRLGELLGPRWALVSSAPSGNVADRGPLKGTTFRFFHLRRGA